MELIFFKKKKTNTHIFLFLSFFRNGLDFPFQIYRRVGLWVGVVKADNFLLN